jgi:hypothetical protein
LVLWTILSIFINVSDQTGQSFDPNWTKTDLDFVEEKVSDGMSRLAHQ